MILTVLLRIFSDGAVAHGCRDAHLPAASKKPGPSRPPAPVCQKKTAEQDGGKEDSVKGTQEGFLSRQINPPAGDRFWPIGQNLVVPVTSLPGLPKRGSFRVQSPARTPRAFPRRCAGSGTGDKLRPKAAICLSLSKNPIGFFDKLRRDIPSQIFPSITCTANRQTASSAAPKSTFPTWIFRRTSPSGRAGSRWSRRRPLFTGW